MPRALAVWCAAIMSLTVIGTLNSQELPRRFQLDSIAVGCVYDIDVVIPSDTLSPGRTYPVAYCLDWFILDSYLESLPKLMALGRLTEPYILVGIAHGSTMEDWATARTRDFTPARPTDEYSKNNMYAPALATAGGAPAFAAMIKDELIPRIERIYPADPSRRCLVGYSLGALFGVYAVTEHPGLFQYYILGSPSLWLNDYYLSTALKKLPAATLSMVQRVYVSVGEDESWEMLKSFGLLRSALGREGAEGLKIKTEIIESSGHVGAMPISLYNGIRFVFQSE